MAEDAETIKYPSDGELLRNIVGVIEHHIGMVEVPMPNLSHHTTKGKRIHQIGEDGARRSAKRD